MEDRQYQTDAIEESVKELSSKRKALLQLATGGGKTVIFAKMARRFKQATGKAVLVLVHRQELMFQSAKTIEHITGHKPVLITANTKSFRYADYYIGMVDSTIRRLDCFANVGLVIIDECHIATFNKIHTLFLEELILGVTATPISSSKKEPMNKYYNSIVTGPSIPKLIEMGFLAQNITRCPKDVVDYTKFEIDNRKGDYNEGKMAEEYKKPKNINNTYLYYLDYCEGKKTIVFNVNIEHSKAVNELFVKAGLNSRHLDSTVSDEERKEILHWFKITDDAILQNVGIATVGFDEPTIICVMLNFSTLSLPKFIQTSGRGGRRLPNKEVFHIIDLGGNCIRFGDWNEDRDWRYMFDNPSLPGDGIAPVKTCPECFGLVHASASVCNMTNLEGEICGHIFDRKKAAEEKELGELMLITKGVNITELVEKHQGKYDYYTFEQLAKTVAEKMYNKFSTISQKVIDDGFAYYYELCCVWYDKHMKGKNGNRDSIVNSTWHIAKAQYCFHKELTILEEQRAAEPKSFICHQCGTESELVCEACEFPVCKDCLSIEASNGTIVCSECESISQSHWASLKNY